MHWLFFQTFQIKNASLRRLPSVSVDAGPDLVSRVGCEWEAFGDPRREEFGLGWEGSRAPRGPFASPNATSNYSGHRHTPHGPIYDRETRKIKHVDDATFTGNGQVRYHDVAHIQDE